MSLTAISFEVQRLWSVWPLNNVQVTVLCPLQPVYSYVCTCWPPLTTIRMCRSCSLLPTPRIHEVLSAVLLVMVWPYLTMIFICDNLLKLFGIFVFNVLRKIIKRCVLAVD